MDLNPSTSPPNNDLTNDTPTTIPTTQEQLNTTLKNLFQVPTQGIQNAFSIILQLVQQQQNEHRQFLKSQLEIVNYKHEHLLESVKKERDLIQSNLQKQQQCQQELIFTLRNDLNLMKQSVHDLITDRDELKNVTNQIQSQQQDIQQVLKNVKEEVRVSWFNIYFFFL
jgi:septal ring factor EnvC (AmiA/AmiB activator)